MKRWLRVVWTSILILVTLMLAPDVALADNCSSLTDCWDTLRAAAAAAAGAGAAAAAAALAGLFSGNGADDPDLPPAEGDDCIDDSCTA